MPIWKNTFWLKTTVLYKTTATENDCFRQGLKKKINPLKGQRWVDFPLRKTKQKNIG